MAEFELLALENDGRVVFKVNSETKTAVVNTNLEKMHWVCEQLSNDEDNQKLYETYKQFLGSVELLFENLNDKAETLH